MPRGSNEITRLKLTYALLERICELISLGNYPDTACKMVAVDVSTFYKWMRMGEASTDEMDIYRRLFLGVRQAEAVAEVNAVEALRSAFPKDWKAAMTFLSRRYSARWAERRLINVQVDKELDQMFRILEERLPHDVYMLVLREASAAVEEIREAPSVDDVIDM